MSQLWWASNIHQSELLQFPFLLQRPVSYDFAVVQNASDLAAAKVSSELDCGNHAVVRVADSCAAADFSTIENDWYFYFSFATATAFVVFALPRLIYLSRRRSVVRAQTGLLFVKIATAVALTGLRLGLLVLAIRKISDQAAFLIVSTALEFTASCILLALSPLEHFKSPRPSILNCAFLLFSFIHDVAHCTYLWGAPDTSVDYVVFTRIFTAATAFEFVFLALESARRARWIMWDAAEHSPEETSSILSLGLYSWLNSLLWKGYHEPLTMQNLYPLDQTMSVMAFGTQDLSTSSNESTGISTWDLIRWLAKPLGRSVLLPVFPRLCLLAFTFCQPFFLQRLLVFLSSPTDDSSTGSDLIAVAVFIYSGIAISTALYWYYQERFQTLLRGFLISAIYRKTTNAWQGGGPDGAAVTLMGADVERIYTGIRLVHEIWANVIQIALASWLLQEQLGLAFLAPLIVVLFGFAGSFALSRQVVPYQSAWMSRVQSRIGFTSAVLANIKDLRVSGMTNPVADLVQLEREDELRVGERSRMLVGVSASISQLPQALAPAFAFAFGPHVLGETRAYTALSYLMLLTSPLLVVLQSIPIIAACIACLRRIRVFLNQEERKDSRLMEIVTSETRDNSEHLYVTQPAFIAVTDGTFGWETGNNILKGINLAFPRSSITFVIGPIASGKSTLCKALLGEVPHVEGSVALGSGKVGYCDQSPFLFNTTVMDNIIGFSPFDAGRYSDVIRATMLEEDLNNLPAGDKTTIGTKGVSLSGGQRQRVSLARALYHDADILVLDDIFSGLDGSTQDQVCRSVFGPNGLLRKRGTTVLICTHSIQFVSVADYIVALSVEGTIVDQGNITEVMLNEQRMQRFGLTHLREGITGQEKLDRATNEAANGPEQPATVTVRRAQSDTTPTKTQPTMSQMVDMAVYRHWLSRIGPGPLILFVILAAGDGFFSNFPTIWLKWWSADSTLPEPQHSFGFWVGIYALLGAAVVLCVFPAGLIMLRAAVRLAGTDLHRGAVHTIMHSSLRFLTSTDVGKVLNLFSQDTNIMDTQLPRMVNNMSFCLATAIGQAVIIAVSSPWLAISYPFFMGMLWVVQRIYLPSSKRLRILDLEAKTPLYTNFLDTLAGLPTIRAFGWFPHQVARNNALLDDSQRPSYLLAMVQQWLTLTMNVLVTILAVALVTVAIKLGAEAGNVGAGLVTLITLGGVLTTIVIAYTGLETSLGAISRLMTFEKETEQEGSEAEDVIPAEQWPTQGHVKIQKINASYDGTNKVLKDLDLVFEASQKVAICGRTGSGKSSILALILRLIEPLSSGESSSDHANVSPSIVIDGLQVNTVDRTILRERVISASQDPVFLPDGTSFRTNLDPWHEASEEECIAVLHDLDLSSVIEARGGLDATISGVELSAGQKQLFNLARAVLRRRVKHRKTSVDGGLLLLDEITSSADSETERRVLRILKSEFVEYTIVMITHRREMAIACDRVIVLDAGKVVEDGKPLELVENKDGCFTGLWAGTNSK